MQFQLIKFLDTKINNLQIDKNKNNNAQEMFILVHSKELHPV